MVTSPGSSFASVKKLGPNVKESGASVGDATEKLTAIVSEGSNVARSLSRTGQTSIIDIGTNTD